MECPNGELTIEWQYDGEEKQVIIGADSYTIEQEQGQCDTNYIVKGRSAVNGAGYCGFPNTVSGELVSNWQYQTTGKVLGIQSYLFDTRTRFDTRPNGQCDGSKTVGTIAFNFGYLAWEGQTSPQQGGIIFFYDNHALDNVIKIDEIIRNDGLPDDCGQCKFTVYKDDKPVLIKSRPECPVVTTKCGDTCPPGSCECSCGNMICCHHPKTGAVVKSFPKQQ